MAGYVIITPAHNEEALIGSTAESVVAQTIRPMKWVVVNDASTDGTRQVLERYAREHSFIEVVNLERAAGRHFGNKVRAFNEGFARVKGLDYDFVGNLDADISFGPVYFENILQQFSADLKLGLAGGMVHTTINGQFVSQEVALDSVAGAVHLYRRKCFEDIGGYIPMPIGGEDSASEISARMHGWRTRTFPEFPVQEHRFTGSATAHPLRSRAKEGLRMYSLGYSPLFFFVRCVYRFRERPFLIGSCAAYYGFVKAALARSPKMVSPEFVRYLRSEQHGKLKRLIGLKGV
jgi:cellulose synthase/poly-beta-1,6-N-acetylglucosamine synthase-like glycosyltransferase